MKKFSAIVKDGTKTVFITNQEYRTKADFIHDLRCNGYKVNPMKVKTSRTFDYIINHPTVTRGIGNLLIKKLMILRIITPEGVCEIWKFGKKTNRRAFLVGSMTLVNCSLAIKEADTIYPTPPKIVNIF